MKKYLVDLSAAERQTLEQLLRGGKAAARTLTRARILLKADEGLSDLQIAEELATSVPTVERVRKRFVAENLQCLQEHARPGQKRKLDPQAEARLVAVACSAAPAGRRRWTLRLLADQVVTLGLAATCAHETVRQYLKKTSSSRGSRNNGASRPSAASLWRGWKTCSSSTTRRMIPSGPRSALTKRASS